MVPLLLPESGSYPSPVVGLYCEVTGKSHAAEGRGVRV